MQFTYGLEARIDSSAFLNPWAEVTSFNKSKLSVCDLQRHYEKAHLNVILVTLFSCKLNLSASLFRAHCDGGEYYY